MDKYSFSARVYPMIILLLPFIVIGIAYSISYKSYIETLTSLGVTGALVYLLSNLGRDRGKKIEPSLWKLWGGAPTTQILSFNNNLIPQDIKLRYHRKLNQLCPLQFTTSPDFEESNPSDSKNLYESWTKYLISQTRDIKKYPLLYKENISYGFRRNLLGLKSYGIVLIIISLLGNYFWQASSLGFQKILIYPKEFYISEAILLIILSFWILIVKKGWVKIPAFAYAERLVETIDIISP